jgi:hypothetical protein
METLVTRLLIALALSVSYVAAQSSAPTLGMLVEGAGVVAGTAAPGTAPISIYDLSFQEKTKIGQANTLAADGTFSAPVRPPLVKGHRIVAVDRDGNSGVPGTVE